MPQKRTVWTIEKIISGGQTGADRAGLDVAIQLGIPHGGWCPRGRRAEDGTIPKKYQLVECDSPDYVVRTELNVRDSDGTIIFIRGLPSGGSALTIQLAQQYKRPYLVIDLTAIKPKEVTNEIRKWLSDYQIRLLNIAGSRESESPGIYEAVKKILLGVLS